MKQNPGIVSAATRAPRLALAALWLAAACAAPAQAAPETALRDYVAAPDAAYSYRPAAVVAGKGYAIHLLSMTSQQWRSAGEVDRPLWSHWLVTIVPTTLRSDTGLVYIAGGVNSATPPSGKETEVQVAAQLALATGSIVTVVANVPNQPLSYADEPYPHDEATLGTYSWKKAMDTGDWSWPAYLPMAKSTVRAMDAVQGYVAAAGIGAVNRFVVIGFSKQAAIAWLTAAVDARVVAIAPGVFDALDIATQFERQVQAYGAVTPVLQPYVDYGIPRRVRAPEGRSLLQVVDPYSYRRMVSIPKFLIHGSGDPFYLPDSAQGYVGGLQGETLLRYVPNADHSLANRADGITNALASLVSWYQSIVFNVPRPQYSWALEGGALTARTSSPVLAARLWQASNPAARDFRRATIGQSWTASALADQGGGVYTAALTPPATGWAAYYIELVFAGPAGVPQTYSTPIYVTPDAMPYALVDAIGAVRGKGYWKKQLRVAGGAPGAAELGAAELAAMLPLPLFDATVATLNEALALFEAHGGAAAEARAECLAVRFNIARANLGWYSRVDLDGSGPRYLWPWVQSAHDAFLAGQFEHAGHICEAINSVDPSGRSGELLTVH